MQAWPEDMWGNDQELRFIMEGKKITILGNNTKEDHKWVYNFPTNGLAGHNQELTDHLRTILDPAKAIIVDTMKLLGKSSYGRMIVNKEKLKYKRSI